LSILFHSTHPTFIIKGKLKVKKWIFNEIVSHTFTVGEINIIFCTDDYLLEINKKYLKHDFFTDIVTFNYNEGTHISGDLYLSIERIFENSKSFSVEFEKELHRVIIHGILHLLGYNDDTKEAKEIIHLLENSSLERFPQ